MKNGDMPAMPIVDDKVSTYETEIHHGMTKREMIAMNAMQGILSNKSMISMSTSASIEWAADTSVKFADALLKELEK